MGFLRGLRSVLISGVFAAACTVGGIQGIVDRVTYESPSESTCQDFEVGANSKWVSLSGCEAMLVDAEYRETTKLKVITSIRVPVRALGSDGSPKFILKTSNKNLISVIRDLRNFETAMEKNAGDAKNEASNEAKLKAAVAAIQTMSRPVEIPKFQAKIEDSSDDESGKGFEDTENAIHLTEVESGVPGLSMPVIALLMGLVWGLLTLNSVRKLLTRQPTGETSALA